MGSERCCSISIPRFSGCRRTIPIIRRRFNSQACITTCCDAGRNSNLYESQPPPVGVTLAQWSRRGGRVPPNVWLLGATSLLTDLSSEMVASVLPVYLLVQLGLSPLAFGALDGLSHGVTTLTRWGSGFVADRWHQHKEVAAVGYALSAACRLALIPVQSHLPGLAAVIAIDRL